MADIDIERNIRILRLLSLYEGLLNDRQREMMSLHYDEDLSLSEIADQFSVSRQAVSQCLRKAEDELVEAENKLGFYSRMEKLDRIIESIEGSGDRKVEEALERIRTEVIGAE